MGALKSMFQFSVAVLIAAIPISYYLVQPNQISNASDAGRSVRKMLPSQTLDNTGSSQQRNPSAQLVGNDSSDVASETLNDVMDDNALEHAQKHTDPTYICPMHPNVMDKDPNAICPICGMDLVILETGGNTGAVKLTPTVINTLGVRTAKVQRRTLYRRIDSVGYIDIDQGKMRTINLRTDGWVEKLFVKTVGDRVKNGQKLFKVYSPKLVNAQEEYVQALGHDNELLINASRERLISLGVPEDQINTLKSYEDVQQQITFYAPQSGMVSKLNIREGMYVNPSQPIMELVDLGSVWLIADIFERQADWVQVGQRAEATLPYMPEKSWEGKVDYIYPSLDASTRSLKVRLQFENLDESLKPNMYADVTVYAKPKKKVLTIPRDAVIFTGTQKRVIVALGEGKFMPMQVNVGMETDKRVEILNGLGEGDEVVVSSQFLIDSESSLKASLARMAGGS